MARRRKFSKRELYQATKQILLNYGYDGFSFGLLAKRLEISRTALYKYFDNKDELITSYMLNEMDQFLLDLKMIDQYSDFEAKLDNLLKIIFKHRDIHRVVSIVYQIPSNMTEITRVNKAQLDIKHQEMYTRLQNFIQLGRDKELLNPKIVDGVIIGFIFQSVDLPNHFEVTDVEWMNSIKEMLCHGMFTKYN